MIHKMMVALGPNPHDHRALEYACQLSSKIDAHLLCGLFMDMPRDPDEATKRKSVVNPTPILGAANSICADHGIAPNIRTISGTSPERICDRMRLADLLVMGIPEALKTDGLRLVYDRLDGVLLRINKPALIVHENAQPLERMLVIYDGDTYSQRALQLALEISIRADISLACLSIAHTEPMVNGLTQEVTEYLEFYDRPVDYYEEVGKSVTHILEGAEQAKADLIVLGATKRGRIYEIIFNSITESVVKLANHAVLVSR